MKQKTDREWVLYIIMEVLEQSEHEPEKHSDTILHQVFSENELTGQTKALIKRLSYGVIERKIELDYIINEFSKTKVKKMKPLIRNILRIGVYELRYMEQIPASATCNEAVKLVAKRGLHGLKGFVNGVLRTISREKDKMVLPDMGVRYSMPAWLVKKLIEDRGQDETLCILKSFFETKPLTIRVNQSKVKIEHYIRKLENDGIRWENGWYMKDALHILGNINAMELPGFQDGEFVVQDESSMLPVLCAGIRPGQMILDLCASPGGKTFQAAEYTGKNGTVYARDLTPYKVQKIQQNALRLKTENVLVSCSDATVFDESMQGKADVVIADVPCSGIGIIGRKPDIKYHISKQRCEQLVKIQRKILSQAVRYVKPGGVLMYSTCTISREENEENVEYIMENFPFQCESMKRFLPESLRVYEKDGMLQMLPGVHKSDGFFVARFICKGSGVE